VDISQSKKPPKKTLIKNETYPPFPALNFNSATPPLHVLKKQKETSRTHFRKIAEVGKNLSKNLSQSVFRKVQLP
jgi:hypothetical protein